MDLENQKARIYILKEEVQEEEGSDAGSGGFWRVVGGRGCQGRVERRLFGTVGGWIWVVVRNFEVGFRAFMAVSVSMDIKRKWPEKQAMIWFMRNGQRKRRIDP